MNQSYIWILSLISSIWIIFIPNSSVEAQILPPDFICVENDTLRWQTVTNTCGPFVSYDIYVSSTISGPYSLLTSITNPASTDYFHMNANSANNTWYYYIESNYNCPGVPVIFSDTLDNRDPDFPPIETVTVTNGQVEIFWSQSDAPETSGYIIYRKAANGSFLPIDNVAPETNTYYLDISANPTVAAEEYTIVAVDDCGNTSIFNTEPQSSIFSTVSIDPCTQSATLNWNLYKNWSDGIQDQEIWVGINGNILIPFDTISPTDTTYIFDQLSDGVDYCFVVRANRNNSTFFSNSNEVCLTASIIEPNRNLVLQTVSFTPDDQIELIWRWDTQAELNTVNILNSNSNSNYSILNSDNPPIPLAPTDTFYVQNHNGNDGKEFYQISTIDDCDTTTFSNYGATIYLSGQSNEDQTNSLNWTPFDIENGTVLEYRLYKQNAVDEFVLTQVPPTQLDYIDEVLINNIYDANACYYVSAYARIELGNGSVTYTVSRSNTICLEQFANIQFPNAFAPNGKNTIFNPLITFPDLVSEYDFNIYDRWGQVVFSTSNPDEGWNGTHKGKNMAAGVYVYSLSMVQNDGKTYDKSGTVMLVR